jgi:2'-5' RNA ligase
LETVRTFIAIEIPGEIQDQINALQSQLKTLSSGISWVKSRNIHLTLKFLGDVPVQQIGAVTDGVTRACEPVQPLTIRIQGTGFFPGPKHPKVIWVGCQYTEALTRLHSGIDQNLAELGFEKETRRFSPHLTIARVKFVEKLDSLIQSVEHAVFDGGEFRANEVVVMKSQLHPAGSIYIPLAKIAF